MRSAVLLVLAVPAMSSCAVAHAPIRSAAGQLFSAGQSSGMLSTDAQRAIGAVATLADIIMGVALSVPPPEVIHPDSPPPR